MSGPQTQTWVAETLVATTLLMAAVLLLRPLVRRLFGAGAAYALWLVPPLRFLPSPFDMLPASAPRVPSLPVEILWTAGANESGPGTLLLCAWAAGACLFAAWHVVAYHRFLVAAIGAADAGGRGVRVIASAAVDGPAAVGFLRRLILVPHDFEVRFGSAERALALRHERLHHGRGDLWANAAALGMLALHWFNPLAYLAYRAFREDQELACDASVIAGADVGERAAYGSAMVKSAWAAAPITTCPMTRSHNLKRRLKMLKTHTKSIPARVGGMLATAIVAVAGLTLTATGGIAAESIPTVKTIKVKRADGEAGIAAALSEAVGERCDEALQWETKAQTRKSGKPGDTQVTQVRIMQCGKASASPTEQLANLKKGRASIATSTSIDAAHRDQILAALDSHIAELEAGR